MRVRALGLALVLTVAACAPARTSMPASLASPTPSPSAEAVASAAATPGGPLSVPGLIGRWTLSPAPVEVTRFDLVGEMIAAAGGDPATAEVLEISVVGGDERFFLYLLHAPGVTPDGFAKGFTKVMVPGGVPVTITVGRWLMWRWTNSNTSAHRWVAGDGDRLVILDPNEALSDEDVATLLVGLR